METDEKLKKLLKTAFYEEELPEGFLKGVWENIETLKKPENNAIRLMLDGFLLLLQPRTAILIIMIAIISGFSAGAAGSIISKEKIIQTKYINLVIAPELR